MGKRKTFTSTEVKRRYNEKTYLRLAADIPKDTAEQFKSKCKAVGISQRQVFLEAVEKFLREN